MNFQPIYTPEIKAMHEQFRVATEKLVREHQIAIEGLTEQQLVSALKQAIQCGDFQRLVVGTSDAQQVIYVPYVREQELEARVKALEECLNGGWVLVESKPVRMKSVLIAQGAYSQIEKCYWDGLEWRHSDDHQLCFGVTHWRPLPAPPTSERTDDSAAVS